MDNPKLLGRFNYLQYRKNIYTLVFVPYVGSAVSIVARNLDFDSVKSMMDELNSTLDDFRNSWSMEAEEVDEN